MKKLICLALLLTAVFGVRAQVKLGTNPTTINSTAIFEMESGSKGLLLPRMTESQMGGITSPATHLMVVCTDCAAPGLRIYNGTSWLQVSTYATFTASSLDCLSGTAAAGAYTINVPMSNGNTKDIRIGLASVGAYSLTTNTVNGVTFSLGGLASSTGTTMLSLTGSGTPASTGTYTYTLTIPGQTACSFSVTFNNPPAVVSAINCGGTLSGIYQEASPTGGSYTKVVSLTVTTAGTYNIVSSSANGLTFSGSGVVSTGTQNVTLTASGTPATASANDYSILFGGQTCSFEVSVAPTASAATFNTNGITQTGATAANILPQAATAYTGTVTLPYTGGNNTAYTSVSLKSNGLTLRRTAGTFSSSGGNVIYTLSGTATSRGFAQFNLPEGGVVIYGCQNDVSAGTGAIGKYLYDTNGDGIQEFGWCAREVTAGNQIWLDRNLGAYRVAASSTDFLSFGSLYQFGRARDGHQYSGITKGVDSIVSNTTNVLANSDVPNNGNFIISNSGEWRSSPLSSFWDGAGSLNNPCPTGYRVPSIGELQILVSSWTGSASAMSSAVKMPLAGTRLEVSGALTQVSTVGAYWSSTMNASGPYALRIQSSSIQANLGTAGTGLSVRCIKN